MRSAITRTQVKTKKRVSRKWDFAVRISLADPEFSFGAKVKRPRRELYRRRRRRGGEVWGAGVPLPNGGAV